MEYRPDLKDIVREKYGEIAQRSTSSSCCGPGCGCSGDTVMADAYTGLDGYVAEADLGLGCGIPTDGAGIMPGDVVLDLGSGAGNDVFVARRLVGDTGKVIGVDFTPAMIEKAEVNRRKLGYENVEFRLGDIEELPVESGSVNVVISNCVLNLVPDKLKAFQQIFRVLKPGGHFSISDIVVSAPLPPALRSVAELYAGCVSGAVTRNEYIRLIESTGFRNIKILKEKQITIPEEDLRTLISSAELEAYYSSGARIESITVAGEKPE
ncbi:MAG: arsenite S-adenosylmethyltransferase [Bacteroidia bacterium]|nr:MAG: arsenite S-adenosylmethyltransferase [Bacteroidia bacterium]